MSITEITHVCPPSHKHGATGTCYSSHRCRCDACRATHRDSANALRRAKAYGRYVPRPMVDAEPVRQHLRQLSEFGIGGDRVAGIANVSIASVRHIRYGRPGRKHPRRGIPPAQVGEEIARRVLAVRADPAHLARNAVVPARGARRRLQALVRQGWSQARLADHLGMSRKQLGFMLLHTPGITVRMHEHVAAVYDELWDKTPPHVEHYALIAYRRSISHAAARGWASPLAWDDIDLDDGPAPIAHTADEDAVNRAVEGDDVTLTPPQRRIAVKTLHGYGLNDLEIAARLRCSDRTVLRIRLHELGLRANAHPRAA